MPNKHTFIFPNFIAKWMSEVSIKNQLKAQMVGGSIMLVGMTIIGIYLIFSPNRLLIGKILIIFNLCACFIFISSFLATTSNQIKQQKEMGY